jgi:hypothetical protein
MKERSVTEIRLTVKWSKEKKRTITINMAGQTCLNIYI